MAERIEQTPYSWCMGRGRIVLLKRMSFRPLWGLLLYISVGFATSSIMPIALVLSQRPFQYVWEIVLLCVALILLGTAFSFVFYRFFKVGRGFTAPVRWWRVGAGYRLACETFRDPRPTGMGGTLPGYPARWLVIVKPGGKRARLVQIYHEPDLLKINCALSGKTKQTVSPSH